ncbi:MAG: CoA transferase [Chloroflexi bacterium]|nr:CoA transferase [Chloroflexota bacterium]
MARPLDGIRVLELAHALAGPSGGMHLADYGADVLKVEPLEGDLWRRYPYMPPGSRLAKARMSRTFIVLNRNKRSLAVDLRQDRGREIMLRLVRRSDVLIENLPTGGMDKLGLGYETLQELNPRLVYASISGLGSRGPEADRRAFDSIAQGRAGILAGRRYEDGSPVVPSTYTSDMACGILLAYAVTMCLFEREKSGKGQRVQLSLLGSALAVFAPQLVRLANDALAQPASHPLGLPYRCQDGRYIILSAITDKQWGGLCKAMDLEHLLEEPLFASATDRQDHGDALFPILETVFLSRPAAEWVERMAAEGVPAGVVQEKEEVFSDPQVLANDFIVTRPHPVLGEVSLLGLPFSLGRTPGEVARVAPTLGEHSEEVLQELGYDDVAAKELRDQTVVYGA